MTDELIVFARAMILTVVVLLGSVVSAAAAPIALLEYIETGLDGGLFRYDYTLVNQSDPVDDTGYDIYDLALFFSSPVSLVSSVLPTDWDVINGADFLDTFSLSPGASPIGADVTPGSAASFTFVFDGQVGVIPFQVVFSNPGDPMTPSVYDGFAAPGSTPDPVPEPASLVLVASGLGGLAARRWRRRM